MPSLHTHHRLNLPQATVLEDWFSPMMRALDKVRFSDAPFKALPMATFILSICLRQWQGASSLRDYLQTLFHHLWMSFFRSLIKRNTLTQ